MDTPPKENPDFFILPMPGENAAADAAVRRALQKRLGKVDYEDVEFQAAIADLCQRGGVNINPNWTALEAAGIAKTAKVTLHLTDVSLEEALQTLLRNLGGGTTTLDYAADEGVVTISTKEDLSQRPVVRVYYVRPIIDAILDSDWNISTEGGHGGLFGSSTASPAPMTPAPTTPFEAKQRIWDIIRGSVEPDSWKPEGTVGAVGDHGDLIVVLQTHNAQREVQTTLRMLMPPWAAGLYAKLHRPVKHVEFDNVPWSQAVREIQEASGVGIVLSPAVKTSSLPAVHLEADNLRVEQVISLLARLATLDWRMNDNAIYMLPRPAEPKP